MLISDLIYDVKKLYRPEYFQGNHLVGRGGNYFEGWYFKAVFADASYAIIPGISLAPGDAHAFLQINDGHTGASRYERYPQKEFSYRADKFELLVGGSSFSLGGTHVAVPGFTAELRVTNSFRWPSTLVSPSSMGWYSFARFMECYHGVIVLDAEIEGTVNGTRQTGRFYLEKDWGRSFPQAWVWLQTNSFPSRASVTCSVARVPFRGRVFTGFIAGLLCGDRFECFTTYNGTVLDRLEVDTHEVLLGFRRGKTYLLIRAKRRTGAVLASPVEGAMNGRIEEALDAEVAVHMEDDGRLVFEETGTRAGLETVNAESLMP